MRTTQRIGIAGLAILAFALAQSAIAQGQLNVLLEPGYDPLSTVSQEVLEGPNPLQELIRDGKYDAAIELMPLIADLNIMDENGQTPLIVATADPTPDGFDISQALLEHGADSNRRDSTGLTPLHWAAMTGSLSVVQLLVDRYSAEVNSPRLYYWIDEDGKQRYREDPSDTPIVRAARSGNIRIAMYLESRGATVPEHEKFNLKMQAIEQAYYEEFTQGLDEEYQKEHPEMYAKQRATAKVEATVQALRDLHAPGEFIEYRKKALEYFYEYCANTEGYTPKMIPELMTKARRRARSELDPVALQRATDEFSKIIEAYE